MKQPFNFSLFCVDIYASFIYGTHIYQKSMQKDLQHYRLKQSAGQINKQSAGQINTQ